MQQQWIVQPGQQQSSCAWLAQALGYRQPLLLSCNIRLWRRVQRAAANVMLGCWRTQQPDERHQQLNGEVARSSSAAGGPGCVPGLCLLALLAATGGGHGQQGGGGGGRRPGCCTPKLLPLNCSRMASSIAPRCPAASTVGRGHRFRGCKHRRRALGLSLGAFSHPASPQRAPVAEQDRALSTASLGLFRLQVRGLWRLAAQQPVLPPISGVPCAQ